ncbi:MAG TPA: OsmC family protein [Gammaproteobacteria bacterium]|nr:OsmC family protein [Gammaproteobacteria bacterium]
MAKCQAGIAWERDGAVFTDRRYSRAHRWFFDGGIEVPASSSPGVVREPLSDASAVDPEEAFVAAISSCHMLSFLDLAARRGFTVESYTDEAAGVMRKNARGKIAVTRVTLHPRITFAGDKRPTREDIDDLHHEAHEVCFIAASVKTDIQIESA